MRFMWFHLMPYKELPADFKTAHAGIWVNLNTKILDSHKLHAHYNEFMDELEFAAQCGFDAVCVNDNSGLARSANLDTLERSAFGRRGALRVARHAFVDFADMRNRAFASVAALERTPDWMLFLDADEVHGEQIRYVAREIFNLLPRQIAT